MPLQWLEKLFFARLPPEALDMQFVHLTNMDNGRHGLCVADRPFRHPSQ